MTKKLTSLILCAALLPASFARAEDAIKVYCDGEEIVFDTAPEIVNERTFAPLRAIAETLAAKVDWDGETETVTLTKDGVVTSITIGSKETKTVTGGKALSGTLDAASYIKDERTMVPLRFISETFGMDVEWDGDTRSVIITSPEKETVSETEPPSAPTEEPAEESTEAPSSEPLTGDELYAKMYEGTGYEFVRNIPELTEDYEKDEWRYKSKQHWGYGKDSDGNGVMYLVRDARADGQTNEVEFKLDKFNEYKEDECINISFDMYVPNAAATVMAGYIDSYKNKGSFLKLSHTLKRGLFFDSLWAEDFLTGKYDDIPASLYFNNNNSEDIAIRNGAHVDLILEPYAGKITTTISNNSNDEEPLVLTDDLGQKIPDRSIFGHGTTDSKTRFYESRFKLWGLTFSAKYIETSKDVIFDNLVTNIVKKAG